MAYIKERREYNKFDIIFERSIEVDAYIHIPTLMDVCTSIPISTIKAFFFLRKKCPGSIFIP